MREENFIQDLVLTAISVVCMLVIALLVIFCPDPPSRQCVERPRCDTCSRKMRCVYC
jgi:hypothetical protein